MLSELVRKTRTVRRFQEERELDRQQLIDLVNLAHLGGSARNVQPLKYLVACEPNFRKRIFPHLGWAGYLQDWPGPAPGERPTGYIVCLLDTRLATESIHAADVDLGIATQNILLGAAERGIFGCRIGSFSKKLHTVLGIKDFLKIVLVIALGYPAETVVLEEVGADGDIRYWRDSHQIHHVPKRRMEDILVEAGSAD
jgi:nitroreductase